MRSEWLVTRALTILIGAGACGTATTRPPLSRPALPQSEESDPLSVPGLLRAINDGRAERGSRALRIDTALSVAAEGALQHYQRLGRGAERRVAEGVSDQLLPLTAVYGGVVSEVLTAGSQQEALAMLEPALNPTLTYTGLAIDRRAQGAAVVMILGAD